jgi:hypothetical protein
MTLAKRPDQLPKKQKDVTVSPGGRVMGTEVLGSKGSGKTIFLAELAFQDLGKGLPQVIFDPLGTLTPALLFRLSRFLRRVPPALHSRYWERLCYVDVGAKDTVVPFPIYQKTGHQSLREVAERPLYVLRLSNPA